MGSEAAVFSIVLIAVTVFISYRGFTDRSFLVRYLFDSVRIFPGREYIRLLSSGFLHADWMHLGLNMWGLFLFGGTLEKAGGAVFFLTVYFAGILGGSLVSLLLHLGKPHLALGASGGVSGLLLAYVFLYPGASLFVFPIPFAVPGWLFAIGFIAVSIVGFRLRAGGIGHDAHLGGALIGLLAATAFYPQIYTHNRLLFTAVVVMTVGFLVATLRSGSPVQRIRVVQVHRRPQPQPESPETSDEAPDRDRGAVIDILLEKISRGGMGSLTPEERALLEKLSKEHRD